MQQKTISKLQNGQLDQQDFSKVHDGAECHQTGSVMFRAHIPDSQITRTAMDPRSNAQDVHRCDLRETAIVHSYCDFCHVNLCIPCTGYTAHIHSKRNEKLYSLFHTSVRELLDEPKLVATIQTGHRTTRTVYKVKTSQTEELTRLQGWAPFNLCVTSTGDLLVTMYSDDQTQSKVVRNSGSTEKQTIQFDYEPLYSGNSFIKYITEIRNHDICVADCEAGAIVVVKQNGKLRWRYTGHPSVTKNKPFKPRGITTDSQSRILTADKDNHCIYILNQNGQFLRYIDNCYLEDPYGLCVDNNDNLFVCEVYKGNVKKLNYLK
ncbi:uncharacterized protein LOC128160815 [Crassostrea angulata]|uniref:uncharacterized protein LOC128160815 n=1 Tax=Magallana angulata TaxID=2784310 RepID=UPI0022B20344|nr:uncharacterized protein LOC128160815 [Crassostrea angulata]